MRSSSSSWRFQRAVTVVNSGSSANASPPMSVARERHWVSVVQLMTHQASCPTQGHAGIGHQGATEADETTVRPTVAIARQADHDEIWTHLEEMVVVQVILCHHTGAKIFHHNIADGDQTFEQFLTFGHLEIQG